MRFAPRATVKRLWVNSKVPIEDASNPKSRDTAALRAETNAVVPKFRCGKLRGYISSGTIPPGNSSFDDLAQVALMSCVHLSYPSDFMNHLSQGCILSKYVQEALELQETDDLHCVWDFTEPWSKGLMVTMEDMLVENIEAVNK